MIHRFCYKLIERDLEVTFRDISFKSMVRHWFCLITVQAPHTRFIGSDSLRNVFLSLYPWAVIKEFQPAAQMGRDDDKKLFSWSTTCAFQGYNNTVNNGWRHNMLSLMNGDDVRVVMGSMEGRHEGKDIQIGRGTTAKWETTVQNAGEMRKERHGVTWVPRQEAWGSTEEGGSTKEGGRRMDGEDAGEQTRR